MPDENQCSSCGKPLDASLPGGMCSACTMALGLDGESGGESTIEINSKGAIQPTEGSKGAEACCERIGPYKLLQQIGEGGCGIVYMAEQEAPVRRRVALKVIKLGMDTKEVIARFEAERQALAMMDHPNIAKVLDAGATETGRPYFVMELVRGIRITKYCDQNRMSTRQRLDLFVKVCQAVQHAHQKGIIHRDLKPSNILVTMHDGIPTPKVIDFGIAKAAQGRLTDKTLFTAFEQFIGTPAYMSPEQAEISGLDVDTRTDIYSLGVLLYEVLTSRPPFDPSDLSKQGFDEIRRRIREDDPPRPSTSFGTMRIEEQTDIARRRGVDVLHLRRQLRGDLDWIVMKCLEKIPSRRYETANGLAADVKRHLNSEALVARPPSKAYHFQKWVRRNKAVVGGTVTVGIALLVGLGLAMVGLIRERHARLAATQAQWAQQLEAARANRTAEDLSHQIYASDIYLAQQAAHAGNLGLAKKLLTRQIPAAGEPDLRGWEWRYLWRRCQSDVLFDLPRQSNSVFSLSVSPDGRSMAVGHFSPREDSSKTVSTIDLETREEQVILTGKSFATAVRYSPSGKRLAASVRNEVHLWDVMSESVLEKLRHSGTIRSLSFSSEDRFLACYDSNAGVVALWDLSGREKVTNLRSGPSGTLHKGVVEFGPQGRFLAVGNSDGSIHLRSVSTWEKVHTLRGPAEGITALGFSPDGRYLASGSGYSDAGIRIWDPQSARLVAHIQGHGAWVSSLTFSPDGRNLASASADQTVRLWEAETFSEIDQFHGHRHEVWSLAYSQDGETLFSGSKNGTIHAWNARPRPRPPTSQIVPKCHQVRFSPVSNLVVGILRNRSAFRWHPGGDQPMQMLDELGSNNTQLVFLPNGNVIMGDLEGSLRLWNRITREVTLKAQLPGSRISPLFVLPKTRTLLTARRLRPRNEIALWDLDTWTVKSWSTNNGWNMSRAVSADEKWLAEGHDDGSISLTSLPTQRLERSWIAHQRHVGGLVFTPDSKALVSVSEDGTAKLWSLDTGGAVAVIYDEINAVFGVAVSHDGRLLALGNSHKEAIRLFDLRTRLPLIDLEGKGSLFNNLRFSADDSMIMGKSDNDLLHVWTAPSWAQIR